MVVNTVKRESCHKREEAISSMTEGREDQVNDKERKEGKGGENIEQTIRILGISFGK